MDAQIYADTREWPFYFHFFFSLLFSMCVCERLLLFFWVKFMTIIVLFVGSHFQFCFVCYCSTALVRFIVFFFFLADIVRIKAIRSEFFPSSIPFFLWINIVWGKWFTENCSNDFELVWTSTTFHFTLELKHESLMIVFQLNVYVLVLLRGFFFSAVVVVVVLGCVLFQLACGTQFDEQHMPSVGHPCHAFWPHATIITTKPPMAGNPKHFLRLIRRARRCWWPPIISKRRAHIYMLINRD